MENYIETGHSIGTAVLLVLYLVLSILLFNNKSGGLGAGNRALAQAARFTLLIVYISGLFLSITLGKIVHNAHHVLSVLPIVVLFSIRFLPDRFQSENKNRYYAWLFAALFILTLIAGISSRLNILPKL